MTIPTSGTPRTILRIGALKQKTGLSTSSIYGLIEEGGFPKPIPLSERRVGWLSDEIDDWISERVAARDAKSLPRKKINKRRETEHA